MILTAACDCISAQLHRQLMLACEWKQSLSF